MQVRGIHNDTLNIKQIDGNFVNLGRDIMGDHWHIPGGREELESEIARRAPENHHEAIQQGSTYGCNRRYAE
ncbi:hypothetical protein ACFO7V_16350 [Glutamicibacter bergerei]|uniref:NUDIX hydrolase n=1 Tax=Glutamicibacter bergerei TaxID=256702 RepID=A0ABV9MNZ9_9MICC|nr:hypothetical protein [Micrococcaceae bacterium]